jgi:hypothetical protein
MSGNCCGVVEQSRTRLEVMGLNNFIPSVRDQLCPPKHNCSIYDRWQVSNFRCSDHECDILDHATPHLSCIMQAALEWSLSSTITRLNLVDRELFLTHLSTGYRFTFKERFISKITHLISLRGAVAAHQTFSYQMDWFDITKQNSSFILSVSSFTESRYHIFLTDFTNCLKTTNLDMN